MRGVRGGLPRAASLCLVIGLGLLAPTAAFSRRAAADKIDESTRQLRWSRAYKVRLSAALFLATQRDARALAALVRALSEDSESTVRRVAALSLARIVDRRSAPADQRAALAALGQASRRDRDRQVRRNAQAALERVRAAIGEDRAAYDDRRTAADRSHVFIHVGRTGDPSRTMPSDSLEEVQRALRGALRRNAPDYEQSSGSPPTRAELATRRLRGYYVGANVSRVAVASRGGRADVSCTVSVRVSPWSGRDGNERLAATESASATGNGQVSTRRADARRAAVDCAVAVAEALTEQQVVPFLRRQIAAR